MASIPLHDTRRTKHTRALRSIHPSEQPAVLLPLLPPLSPRQVIARVGNFVTGSAEVDEEDVLSAATKQLGDGRPYHLYEIYTPYAKEGGQHHLAAFGVKVCEWVGWGWVGGG